MPYSFSGKIRYSECGHDGFLTPVSAINYFQDASTFQSEELSVGIEYLKKKHRAWFLNSWLISFDRMPRFGEYVTAGTFAHGFDGIYGLRHFYLKDENGDFLVRADSLWFFFDTERRLPVRPEKEDADPYLEANAEELSKELMLPKIERKLKLPKEAECGKELYVTRHFLDSNEHVNNAWYVEFALDAAGIERPKSLRVEYKRAAVLSDIIVPYVQKGEGKTVVMLSDTEKKPYAVVELYE